MVLLYRKELLEIMLLCTCQLSCIFQERTYVKNVGMSGLSKKKKTLSASIVVINVRYELRSHQDWNSRTFAFALLQHNFFIAASYGKVQSGSVLYHMVHQYIRSGKLQ